MEKFTPNVYQNARSCFKQKVEVQTKCVLFGHNIKDIISQTVCCFNLLPFKIIAAIYVLFVYKFQPSKYVGLKYKR